MVAKKGLWGVTRRKMILPTLRPHSLKDKASGFECEDWVFEAIRGRTIFVKVRSDNLEYLTRIFAIRGINQLVFG